MCTRCSVAGSFGCLGQMVGDHGCETVCCSCWSELSVVVNILVRSVTGCQSLRTGLPGVWLLAVLLLLVCGHPVFPAGAVLSRWLCAQATAYSFLCLWPSAAFLRIQEGRLACCKLPGNCCMVPEVCRCRAVGHQPDTPVERPVSQPCDLCHNTVTICLCMGTHHLPMTVVVV